MAVIRVDPWWDLVFHVLSSIPVDRGDASSLYDPAYVVWSMDRTSEGGPAEASVPRTLVEDGPLLGALYAACPIAHRLALLVTLWDDVDGFMEDMATPFDEIAWPTSAHRARAMSLVDLGEPLVELTRAAVWSEQRAGYGRTWLEVVAPRGAVYEAPFEGMLAELATALPGLDDADVWLCHPLRRHGRVLTRPGASAVTIAVGVGDEALQVPDEHPPLQAFHELVVHLTSRAGLARSMGAPYSTDPRHPGFASHRTLETAALVLGARLVPSPWRERHLTWLEAVYPLLPRDEIVRRVYECRGIGEEVMALVDAASRHIAQHTADGSVS